MCPEGLVYDLTVEHHHNFFADGILTHNCATSLWVDIVQTTHATYRLGLTATPERKSGVHVIVEDVIGPVVAEGEGEQLHVQYTWERTNHTVKPFRSWTTMQTRLVQDDERNRRIAERVVEDAGEHFVLITTERHEHVERLTAAIQELDPELSIGHLTGRTRDREGFRRRCKEGDYRVVIAMSRIVQLGYNVPRWSCFHNVLPMADAANWYQRVSRIRTPAEPAFEGDEWTKPQALARVWVDDGHPAVYAYRSIVRREHDRLGFECLNDVKTKFKP